MKGYKVSESKLDEVGLLAAEVRNELQRLSGKHFDAYFDFDIGHICITVFGAQLFLSDRQARALLLRLKARKTRMKVYIMWRWILFGMVDGCEG